MLSYLFANSKGWILWLNPTHLQKWTTDLLFKNIKIQNHMANFINVWSLLGSGRGSGDVGLSYLYLFIIYKKKPLIRNHGKNVFGKNCIMTCDYLSNIGEFVSENWEIYWYFVKLYYNIYVIENWKIALFRVLRDVYISKVYWYKWIKSIIISNISLFLLKNKNFPSRKTKFSGR